MTLEQDSAETVLRHAEDETHESDIQQDARALKAKVDFMLTGYETAVVDAAIAGEPIDMDLFNSLRNEFPREIAAWRNKEEQP